MATRIQDPNDPSFWLKQIPWLVILIALAAACYRAYPIVRAQLSTPEGWEFTGNLSNSPDVMQYRVWMRQSQTEGPVVTNIFTAEPNPPHVMVVFYYLMGKASQWLNITPEFVSIYVGVLIAFALVIVIFLTARIFMPNAYQAWWIFGLLLLAGGAEVHLRYLSNAGFVRQNGLLNALLAVPLANQSTLAEMRGMYPLTALVETHYSLLWLLLIVCMLLLYFALRKFTPVRFGIVVIFSAIVALVHVYTGLLLLLILASMAFLMWRKKLLERPGWLTLGGSGFAVLAAILLYLALQANSGLPFSEWRGPVIYLANLFLAYPLAWLVILFGFLAFWKSAAFNEVFLSAWAVGCCLMALSGPYFLYPARGILTLQVPLYVIAGIIFFRRYARMPWWGNIAILFVALALPISLAKDLIEFQPFRTQQPSAFLNENHQEIIATLQEKASRQDFLIDDMKAEGWELDLLWLAPDYPGRFYCGHFYLCADYARKRKDVIAFYRGAPEEQAVFLSDNNIRFVFVPPHLSKESFEQIQNLKLLITNPAGSLYEFIP